MATALITGATSGIGSAFAEELARQGHNIVLVARDTVALAKIAQQVRGQGVEAEILAADLADLDQLNAVAARLADAERPIDICVNNAGLGVREEFATSSVAEEQLMIDVMVTAVMRLSHAVLPVMLNRGYRCHHQRQQHCRLATRWHIFGGESMDHCFQRKPARQGGAAGSARDCRVPGLHPNAVSPTCRHEHVEGPLVDVAYSRTGCLRSA